MMYPSGESRDQSKESRYCDLDAWLIAVRTLEGRIVSLAVAYCGGKQLMKKETDAEIAYRDRR